MSTTLSVLTMVALAAATAVPPTTAGDLVRVDVPFAFVLAGRPLPSGEYRFEMDETTRVVHVHSKARGHVAVSVCQPVPATSREVGLVFHKHAGQRFLKAVTTGHGVDIALPTTPAERAAEAADAARRPVAAMR